MSRYQSNPGLAHWQVVKRIFRYLCGISDLVLCYQTRDLRLRGYSDVDWGGDLEEYRSTSRYVFTFGGGVISWCSKKQDCVDNGSRIRACYLATQEAIWLKSFLQDLRLTPRVDDPVELMCDNTAAIQFAKDLKFHRKTSILRGVIILYETPSRKRSCIKYISTSKMLAALLLNLFLEMPSKHM